MNPLIKSVLEEVKNATIRDRFRPDMLMVNYDQFYELQREIYCHGAHVFGMKMLPVEDAPKIKAFLGTLR